MTITVLIATYNMKHRLPRTIASAEAGLEKLRGAGEILVVDDGSSDGTGNLQCLKHSQVRYLWHPHEGIAAALNAGIRQSRADYIAILDCGDTCDPWRFWTQATRLTIGQHLLGVGCRPRIVHPDTGEVLATHDVIEDPTMIRRMLPRMNVFQHSSMMFRRDALLAVGGYRPFFKMAADYDLLLRLSERGDLTNLRDITCDRVLDEDSASFRWAGLMAAEARIARRCAAERHRGERDCIARGEAKALTVGMETDAATTRSYMSAVSAALLVDGNLERAREMADAAGNRKLKLLSRCPRRVVEILRRLRLAWAAR